MLDAIAALARDAGLEIFRIWKAGVSVDTKLDGSPVTIADRRAEAIIHAGLARIAPGVPVVAEEANAEGETPDFGDRFFLVDPLDGTRGFSEGKPDYTVNIGLIERNIPVLGVIYAPSTGALYAGDANGAWRGVCDPDTAVENGARIPMVAPDNPAPFRIVGSNSYAGPKFKAFAAAVGQRAIKTGSSSLKFCQVAADEADLYPRFGGLSEWDVAAGHAILRAAGGGVMRLDGSEIVYGRVRENFELDGVIAYGGPRSERAARAALG